MAKPRKKKTVSLIDMQSFIDRISSKDAKVTPFYANQEFYNRLADLDEELTKVLRKIKNDTKRTRKRGND